METYSFAYLFLALVHLHRTSLSGFSEIQPDSD